MYFIATVRFLKSLTAIELVLVAVVLKASQSAYTPASPPFNLFLKILSFISTPPLSYYCSLRHIFPPSPLFLRLDGQSVPQESPNHVDPNSRTAHVSSAVANLEKMGLHVVETCVEDQFQIRGVWHFGHKLIFVHHLRHIEGFLAENFAQFFPPLQSLVLVGQVDHLHSNSPQFPRNVFRRKRPSCASSLEEFQRYLTGPQSGRLLELAGEGGNLPTQVRVQAGRRGPDIGVIDTITINVLISYSARTVTALALVGELASGPVEEYRVEDCQNRLLSLPSFHRQFKYVAPGVHGGRP